MFLLNLSAISFFRSMLHYIRLGDQWLFLKINTQWTNSFLDTNLPWWREMQTWIPVYLFLFVFVIMNFKKQAIFWIVFIALTITISDQLSSTIIKAFIHRVRPCSDPFIMFNARLLLNHCPLNGSFTSSHATNHFAAATFIFITLKKYLKNWSYLFFFWAASISYAQVYVGVHYPLDIIGGALLGSLIGYITANLFNRSIHLPEINIA